MDGGALAQGHQNVQQGVAILAARQADHHLVAFFYHIEVADGLAYQAAQALVQLVVFQRDLVGLLFSRLLCCRVRRDGDGGLCFIKHGVHIVHTISLIWNTSTPTPSQSGYTSGFIDETRAARTCGWASMAASTSSTRLSCNCTWPWAMRLAMVSRMKS